MKQVDKSHYYNGYDKKTRWMSYFHQVDEVLKLEPNSVLEIGVGSGLVSDYLKKRVNRYTTVDIDSEIKPDVLSDVLNISENASKHDVILCCQVLEHITFDKFDSALEQLQKTSDYVVMSLPDNNFNCCISTNLRMPFKRGPRGIRKNFKFTIPIPDILTKKHSFDGEHYWEIGKKGYSLPYIRSIIKKYFAIENEYFVNINPYHRFFILKSS